MSTSFFDSAFIISHLDKTQHWGSGRICALTWLQNFDEEMNYCCIISHQLFPAFIGLTSTETNPLKLWNWNHYGSESVSLWPRCPCVYKFPQTDPILHIDFKDSEGYNCGTENQKTVFWSLLYSKVWFKCLMFNFIVVGCFRYIICQVKSKRTRLMSDCFFRWPGGSNRNKCDYCQRDLLYGSDPPYWRNTTCVWILDLTKQLILLLWVPKHHAHIRKLSLPHAVYCNRWCTKI